MKVLVDRNTGLIRGAYEPPIAFSISGHYMVDVPDYLSVDLSNQNVANLVTNKTAALLAPYSTTYGSALSDELITTTNIDTTLSTLCVIGPGKRTIINPGGTLYTTQIAHSFSKARCHFSCFVLFRDNGVAPSPPASRILYNHTSASTAVTDASLTSQIIATVTNGAGGSPHTLNLDTDITYSSTNPFRLAFTNIGLTPVYLSDWTLLYV